MRNDRRHGRDVGEAKRTGGDDWIKGWPNYRVTTQTGMVEANRLCASEFRAKFR